MWPSLCASMYTSPVYKGWPSSTSSVQGVSKFVHMLCTNWTLAWAHVHLRSYCPKTASAETRKWYPLCLSALGAGEYVDQSRSSEWEIPGDTESVVPNTLGGTEPESVARCWEVEATEPHTQLDPISVKGRLKKCLQF